jgi:hypothetical protein
MSKVFSRLFICIDDANQRMKVIFRKKKKKLSLRQIGLPCLRYEVTHHRSFFALMKKRKRKRKIFFIKIKFLLHIWPRAPTEVTEMIRYGHDT